MACWKVRTFFFSYPQAAVFAARAGFLIALPSGFQWDHLGMTQDDFLMVMDPPGRVNVEDFSSL